MEVSALQVLKYLFVDMNRFQFYKQQWCSKNKNEYELAIAKFKQHCKPPYVMDLPLDEITFTVFDLETTGFFPRIGDEVVSIGATKINVNHMKFSEHFYEVVRPIKEVPEDVYDLTGLTTEQVQQNGKPFPLAFANFVQFSYGTILVALPASFDVPFLQELAKRWGFPAYSPYFIDAYEIAKKYYPYEKNSLDSLVKRFNIAHKNRHHALNDANMTAELFFQLLHLLKDKGITTYKEWLNVRKKHTKFLNM